jgi:lysophospholipase L1-like esterase
MALAGFVTAGALPAAAAPGTVQYVALGDSYAAGTAVRKGDGTCLQSEIGYPKMLDDSESRIVLMANVACSGATTSEVAENQLSALDRHTRLVTLTVGATNLHLSAVAAACIGGTLADCLAAIGPAQRELGDCPGGVSPLGGRLIKLYGEVAGKAPGARIIVTGYPLLFEPPTEPDPADPDLAAKITAINEATAKLNCVVERAVTATQATYANIRYVDVTEEFAGHGIGCNEPQCLFIYEPPNPEAFHPTAEGYAAYAEAIKAKLPGGWLDEPST